MGSKSVVDMIEASSGVHFSGFHMDGLDSRNAENPSTSPATDNIHNQPFVIGVAGGAASGKTTVCDMIIQQLHDQRVVLVNQDSFYHNLTEEELSRVHDYNFDHPGRWTCCLFHTGRTLIVLIPIALDMAKDSNAKDHEWKKRLNFDNYMLCAVRECYASFKNVINFLVLREHEKLVINDIFFQVDEHIEKDTEKDTLITELDMSALPYLYEQFVKLIEYLIQSLMAIRSGLFGLVLSFSLSSSSVTSPI